MNRILVTGGAGFIGSHLVERLLKEEARVVCLDNFDDYYDPEIKRRNIESCLKNSRFELIEGDIRNRRLLASIFKRKFDVVVHLAAMAGVHPSMKMPLLFEDVNVKGTISVLEACYKAGIKRLVFASSSSVYGDARRIPFRENDEGNHPVSVYGATKTAGEVLCKTYHHLYGIDITCLRYFTAYGPRQRPDMAIHKFARCIAAGEEVTIYGDGTSRRDYTYIDDIIDGTLKAIKRVKGFGIYNLGESNVTSLKALVRLLERYMGKKARVAMLPHQPGDPYITCADVSRARRVLGYRPKVGIEEGIQRFVSWFRDQT